MTAYSPAGSGVGSSVQTAELDDLAVTTGKINDLAVTTGKVADAAITLAKQANLAQNTIIGRETSGTGVPEALTQNQARLILGISQRSFQFVVFPPLNNVTTGDGAFYFVVPPEIDGWDLSTLHARVITAGTTGTTDIQIHNVTDAVDMLTVKLTVDSGETGSDTATAADVNTSNDNVSTNDLLRIDVDAVSTTPPKGLIIRLRFKQV